MKVVFFCEGDSEAKSVIELLHHLQIPCIPLKRTDSPLPDGQHGIFIHNSRNDCKTLKDLETKGKTFLEKLNYDFAIAWCDRPRKNWCPKTIIKEIRERSGCGRKMILLASIKCLENWLFADRDALLPILLQNKLSSEQYEAFLKEMATKSQNWQNVEELNALYYLEHLTWAVHGKATKYDKITTAFTFFPKFSPDKVQGAKSFSWAIQRLKDIFKT
jgi:hypothetical protein